MKKRILGFALALIFTTAPFSAAYALFGGVNRSASDDITAAISKGFVPADLQSDYDSKITRAEFCRLAVKWLEVATGRTINGILAEKGLRRDNGAFTDTSDSDVLAAYALGIIGSEAASTGTAPERFNPAGQLDRQSAAVMIRNICKVLGLETKNPPPSRFSDAGDISEWSAAAVDFCAAAGILERRDGLFGPLERVSRREGILMLHRIRHNELAKAGAAKPTEDWSVPVLMYHCVEDNETNNAFYVSVADFEAHLRYLYENDYRTITMRELTRMVTSGEEVPPRAVVLTFDDGYINNYTNVLPLLEKYGMSGTVYALSFYPGWACTPEMLRDMNRRGMEIGSHTKSHANLTKLAPEEAVDEITRSKEALERVLGIEITSFAYPYGAYNTELAQAVKNAGYQSAVSMTVGHASPGQSLFELRRYGIYKGDGVERLKRILENKPPA
ncbi:MAG: polysaccharide deacetylase family protein [Oscillospiraceae bacterium]|jgi:peptidoglycan/xylan/chitin deacetylase (PgdA/CDA1 family)|nr:polysaccharide deacetylase family protein [Oscillospiraceae bacterium]